VDLKETVGEIKVQQAEMRGEVKITADKVDAQGRIVKYVLPALLALLTGGGVVGNRVLLGGVVGDINAATDTTSAIEAPADRYDEAQDEALAEEDDHDDDGT